MAADSDLQSIDSRTYSRLCWQCRRGMLELDMMLQAFMAKHISGITDRQLKAFESLLECNDQLLLDYLMGHAVPFDKDVANVVKQIRGAAGP